MTPPPTPLSTPREAREAQSDADAARKVANTRLDRACERFADELLLAVDKDRTAARWVQFFHVPVSKFVRQALNKQVERVQGWLRSKDPVLETHRKSLETWVGASDAALQQTAGVATVPARRAARTAPPRR